MYMMVRVQRDMGKYDKSTTTMANITTANTCTMSGGSR